ncbi:MAG: FAD-dependent oxidoreductase [Candidatus Micrarchaeaceae archaeon]
MKKIIIAGAGDGGIILANSLKAKDYEITMIDMQTRHYFQPLLLHIAFEGAKEKSIDKAKLIPKGAKFINEKIDSIDIENREVVANGKAYAYDYLVVDTGSMGDYSKIPGHKALYEEFGDFHSNTQAAQKLYSKVQGFKGGNAVIGISYPTYKCPPSPLEAAFLFEQYINSKKLKASTHITFVTPFPRAYPAEPMNEIAEPLMKQRGIEVKTFFDVESIDTQNKKIFSIEGDEINYDFAALVPPHVGAGLVKDNCDEDGFVKADKYTLTIGGHDDAFCIGDATNIPTSKSAVTAHLEAKVVEKRIAGIDARFDGRTNCPFETGYGKGTFVISSYTEPVVKLKPSRFNYFMKKGMAMMAWPALKGNMDFVFNMYFKHTDPAKLNKKSERAAPEKS